MLKRPSAATESMPSTHRSLVLVRNSRLLSPPPTPHRGSRARRRASARAPRPRWRCPSQSREIRDDLEDRRGIVSEGHALRMPQALHEQARTDQQHNGKGPLQDKQRGAHARAMVRPLARSGLERAREVARVATSAGPIAVRIAAPIAQPNATASVRPSRLRSNGEPSGRSRVADGHTSVLRDQQPDETTDERQHQRLGRNCPTSRLRRTPSASRR